MIVLNLIQNVALLVALAAIYEVIESRLEKKTLGHQILSGFLFGGVGIVGMMTPIYFQPGIIFDGRSIILSVAGLFGGPLVAAVAATMCGAYRIWLGGGGAWVGVSVILESAGIGVVFYFLWRSSGRQIGALSLWMFGLLVHVIMLAIFQALPGGAGPQVLRQIGLPILVFYPLATMVICQIFLDYEKQLQAKKALRQSEELQRTILSTSPVGIGFSVGRSMVWVNDAWKELFGFGPDESGLTVHARELYPTQEEFERVGKVLYEGLEAGHARETDARMIRKDGTILEVHIAMKAVDPSDPSKGTIAAITDITDRKRAEEALKESENRYRSLVETSPDPIIVYDLEGNIVTVNQQAAHAYGVASPELVLAEVKNVLDILDQDSRKKAVENIQRTLVTGSSRKGEYTIIRKDGTAMPVEINSSTLTGADGKPIAFISSVRDLTERKISEEALRESEEAFRSIFENSLDGIFFTAPDGSVIRANEAACRMLGRTEQEICEEGRDGLVDLTDPRLGPALEERMRTGRFEGEFRWKKKDGTTFDAEVSSGIFRTSQGDLRTSIIVRDITDRKKAEEALRESESRFRGVVENAAIGIDVVDQQGRFLLVNEVFAEMLGYTVEELMGLTIFDISHPDDREFSRIKLDQLLHNEIDSYRFEKRYVRKDGLILWADASVSAVRGPDSVHVATVGVISDITDRKRAEEALRGSEFRYRSLFDNMSDAVAVYKAAAEGEDFLFVDFNKTGEQIDGVTKEQILGKSVQQAYPGVMECGLFEVFQRVWRTGLPEHHPVALYRDERLEGWRENFVYKLPSGEIVTVYRDDTERQKAKQAIEAEKRKFEALAESSPFGMAKIRQDGSFEYINPKFREIFGYELSEIPTGRAWFRKAFPDPDYRHEVIAAWFEDLEKAAPDELRPRIFTATCKDGTQKIIHFRPVLLSSGEHVITYEDITFRQKAEAALKNSERRLAQIVEFLPDATMVIDKDRRLIAWNRAMEDLTEVEASSILGKDDYEYALPFYGIRRPIMLDLVIDFDENVASQYRFIRRDGSRLFSETFLPDFLGRGPVWLWNAAAPLYDSEGHLVGAIEVVRDITERKKSEAALLESEQKYRTLFEESMDGVYSVLREGVITDANKAFCELFGYTRDEMIGKDIRELYFDPSARLRFQREIEKDGFVKDYELTLRKRDGTAIDCLLSSSVAYEKGGSILGYRGILRDLTIRKGLQKQLLQAQKMEAIGTLAGGVAHDFNNVLQVALGYSELILGDEALPERSRTDLKKISDASRRGADLVQRLLTFSRNAEIKPQPLNLNRRIHDLQKMLERTIPKMVEMQLVLSEDLATINADPTQIDQVLMNLAVNARDAMPEGGTLIFETANVMLDEEYASTRLNAKPGSYVLLMVTDTGSGMDQETLEHIFEPFYTTKGVGEGTGLGLAVVHGIVQQHGGNIRCYSEPGRGTTFKIYFPALTSDEEGEQPSSTEMPQGGSETILLVDDEAFIRDLGSRILMRAGYTVITASNGKEGLEAYQTRGDEIAAVILDLVMPEMGGKQCLEALVRLNPSVKAIIASGFSSNGPVKEALSAGAKGFVNKPYDMRQMLEVVRKVLDAKGNDPKECSGNAEHA